MYIKITKRRKRKISKRKFLETKDFETKLFQNENFSNNIFSRRQNVEKHFADYAILAILIHE